MLLNCLKGFLITSSSLSKTCSIIPLAASASAKFTTTSPRAPPTHHLLASIALPCLSSPSPILYPSVFQQKRFFNPGEVKTFSELRAEDNGEPEPTEESDEFGHEEQADDGGEDFNLQDEESLADRGETFLENLG